MPRSAIEGRTRRKAQILRRQPTDAERRLWQILRMMKPLGFHFRRQAPIGPYVADFVWYSGKLVLEVDGGQHAETQRSYDERRTAWLESQGYRVVRFWNNDVLRTPEAVGEMALLEAEQAMHRLRKNPTPHPSPRGGGERAGASGEDIA
jgi:very-short-patch-repair endonuclease